MWKFVILIVILFSLLGCDGRTLDPEDAKHAWLHVNYNDDLFYSEVLQETDNNQTYILNLPDNSQITLEKFVNIEYEFPPEDEEEVSRSYIVWAKKADYYTQFAQGSYLDTLLINASGGFTPVVSGNICGSICTTAHSPVIDAEFYIVQDSVVVDSIETSSYGYFDVDLPFGNYLLMSNSGFGPPAYREFIVDSFYKDYAIINVNLDYKPNIYIYPVENMELDVNIIFPHGGDVITSKPDYGEGWKDLKVSPSGKINQKYSYLFYESTHPDFYQYKDGWLIPQKNLESFFSQNLAETGFEGQEIIDFTDYWIPLLIDSPYYAIYPQYKDQLDKMVDLEFSIKPDNLLRLIYSIEGREEDTLVLQEPEIPEFKREGFFVVEWGVSLKPEEQNIVSKM